MSRPIKKSRKVRSSGVKQTSIGPYREVLDLWSLDSPPSPKLVIEIPSTSSDSRSSSSSPPQQFTPVPPSNPPPSRASHSNSSFVDRYLSHTTKSYTSSYSMKSSFRSTQQSVKSTVVGDGYVYGPYSAIPRVDPAVCVDWAKTHMLVIALDGEDDNFNSDLKALFQQISENPSSLETLNLYPTALRLLHQLHSELHCPPHEHKKFWKVYCKPSTGNFAVLLTRLSTLSYSRSHLLDVLRFASGNPTPQLISRLLRMKRHGHDETRQIDMQRFSMMGQSPQQIRARARATIINSPVPNPPTSPSLGVAPPALPAGLMEKVERHKLQSSLSAIQEDDSEDSDDEDENEEELFSDNDTPNHTDTTDSSSIPVVTFQQLAEQGTEIDEERAVRIERKRSQRSSTSTARTGLLKRIVEEWIQSVPWRIPSFIFNNVAIVGSIESLNGTDMALGGIFPKMTTGSLT